MHFLGHSSNEYTHMYALHVIEVGVCDTSGAVEFE